MNRVNELLLAAEQAYYAGKDLVLSDEQYDRLTEMYEYETLGTKPSENTSKHLYRMYSLKKHFTDEGELPVVFLENSVVETPKLDGAAISLYYINGEFSHALTRGDGVIGQDISDKIPFINNIPLKITNTPVTQISGEVVASNKIPNARNYAAGALNLKSLEEFQNREQPLYFFAYGSYPMSQSLYRSDLKVLENLGFKTVLNDDTTYFNHDGKVIRLNSNALFSELGHTNHHPRGAIAVKERSEGVPTKLLDVVWQVGKSGRVTPVAILEPVVIGEATISRATLNNAGFIRAMDLHIGDMVSVIRSGEIIPTILGKWVGDN